MFQEIIYSMFAVIPIIVVALSIMAWCIESDRVGLGTLLFIGSCVYLGFATDWTFISIAIAHAIPVTLGFLAYLAIGIMWAFFKWYLVIESFTTGLKVHLYNFRQTDEYQGSNTDMGYDYSNCMDELKHFLTQKNLDDSYGSDYNKCKTITDLAQNISPKAANNKARITGWIAYFPISMMWTVLHDAVRKLFNRIYKAISGSFQTMSDKLTTRAFK